MRRSSLLLALGLTLGCGSSSKPNDALGSASSALTSAICANQSLHVADLRADFREIWKGLEVTASGKQATSNAGVALDFSAPVSAALVSGSFEPLVTNGSCGSRIPTAPASGVIAAGIWGTVVSNASRAAQPEGFNVLALETITGIANADGALAAGGDIKLSGVGVNLSAHQKFGLIAGGKAILANGMIAGDVSYGVPSTVPQTVSVSGQKSLTRFLVGDAFQSLAEVSNLVASGPAPGTVQLSWSTLTLTGSSAGANVFRVPASMLPQATSIEINVPNGAAAIVDVTGTSVQLQSKGVSVHGATPSTLLWNFAHATSLNVTSIAIPGSVLAPRARLAFNGGNINGSVVVRSLITSGTGALQYTPLNAALVFGAVGPSSVTLMPSRPLTRGCAYRFSIPTTAPLTSAQSCLDSALDVTFRVADDRLGAAERELTDEQLDRTSGTLQRFVARGGINTPVSEALLRYESALGVSASELSPGTARRSVLGRAQQTTHYSQVSQGYPVDSYGYEISTENGLFRSAVGKLMPSLPSFPAPSVTETNALKALLAALHVTQAPWLLKPTVYQAPRGELTLAASKPYPAASDFKLVWRFPLGKKTGIFSANEGRVDAATGSVSGLFSPIASVATFDPTDTATYTYTGKALQNVASLLNGPQQFFGAQYAKPDNTAVVTLANGKLGEPLTLATALAKTDVMDLDSSKLDFIVHSAADNNWPAGTDVVEARMASVQWGLQLTNEFLPTLNQGLTDGIWDHLDGSGPTAKRRVLVHYVDGPSAFPTSYHASQSDAEVANISIRNDSRLFVGPTTIAHEYGHALHDSLRNLNLNREARESGSINEAVADLYAVALAQAKSLTPSWQCIWLANIGDAAPSMCDRNLGSPPLGNEKQPILYKGPGYQDYSTFPDSDCEAEDNNDLCGVHINSSIVSHWGYLLAVGSGTQAPTTGTSAACNLAFPPVDPDLTTALRIVNNIALRAAAITPDEATFSDFRNSSLLVASQLQAQYNRPNLTELVALAWSGVGLTGDSAKSQRVLPADDSTDVSPWVTFAWPALGSATAETSWDFQLATSPAFDSNSIELETDPARPITDTFQDGTETKAFLKLALSSEKPENIYWRVRPHTSGAAWASCYPIHSFITTGVAPKVKEATVLSTLVDEEHPLDPPVVRPGKVGVQWSNVVGVKEYELKIGAGTDPACEAAPGVFAEKKPYDPACASDACSPQQTLPSQGPPWLLPNKHYFLNVRPVGPPDLSGAPSVGQCTSVPFETGEMRAPDFDPNGKPDDNAVFFDGLNGPAAAPQFQWNVHDGAVRSRLHFWTRDAKGKCVGNPVPKDIETPCGECVGKADGANLLPFPPNPTGYCWDVVGIAADDTPSPASEQRHLLYQHLVVSGLAPGAQLLDALGFVMNKEPAPLPDDSYGKDVTFRWAPDPSASEYVVRLDRWEGLRVENGSHEPDNCIVGANPFGNSGLCNVPLRTIAKQTVPGGQSSLTIPGSTKLGADGVCEGPSCGRYCWSTWPLFEGADGKAVPSPYVELDRECYTSAPSNPVIFIDEPADLALSTGASLTQPQAKFTGQTIKGHIHYDYVPDNQVEVAPIGDDGKPVNDIEWGPKCPTTYRPESGNFDYAPWADVYNCDRTFTIKPQPMKSYDITTRVSNRGFFTSHDTQPPPPPVFDITLTLTTPACGTEGAGCCSAQPFCAATLGCTGEPGNGGTCELCGHEGNKCCQTQPVATPYPATSRGCDPSNRIQCFSSDTKCHHCGKLNEACCPGSSCDAGVTCNASKHVAGDPNDGMCEPACGPAVMPGLGTLTAYTQYCKATGGQIQLTEGLQFPACELTDPNTMQPTTPFDLWEFYPQLLECHQHLQFTWVYPGKDTCLDHYRVNIYSWPGFESVDVMDIRSNIPGGVPPTNYLVPDDKVQVLTGNVRLFQVVVRAVGKDGQFGPPAIGMMAKSDLCQ